MRTPWLAVLVMSITLVGCSGDDDDGWSRVVSFPEGDGYYSIVHVDPLTDTCVKIGLHGPASLYPPDADFDVEIRGADWTVQSANGDDMAGPGCTNGYSTTGGTSATGTIEFVNFINSKQTGLPCSVSFDLVIQAFNGKTYEISKREFPIFDVGCPRPGVYTSEYTDLGAAYGEHNGVGNLIISSWDPEHQVCVWARFLSANDTDVVESQVEVEGTWFYTGLRFGRTEHEACVASEFIVPPVSTAYLSDSAPALDSAGSVTFGSSQLEAPCTLDVDLSLQSQGRYYWTPDDVVMRATGLTVAGACD